MQRNMSQMDLAVATGISQSAIAKWELGKTEPTATAIITLARFFEESADYLFVFFVRLPRSFQSLAMTGNIKKFSTNIWKKPQGFLVIITMEKHLRRINNERNDTKAV